MINRVSRVLLSVCVCVCEGEVNVVVKVLIHQRLSGSGACVRWVVLHRGQKPTETPIWRTV